MVKKSHAKSRFLKEHATGTPLARWCTRSIPLAVRLLGVRVAQN
jgi:hypothetical protein